MSGVAGRSVGHGRAAGPGQVQNILKANHGELSLVQIASSVNVHPTHP